MAMVILSASVEIFSVSRLQDLKRKEKQSKCGHYSNWQDSPSILSSCRALLQVNFDIFSNAKKQLANVWPLKIYKAMNIVLYS